MSEMLKAHHLDYQTTRNLILTYVKFNPTVTEIAVNHAKTLSCGQLLIVVLSKLYLFIHPQISIPLPPCWAVGQSVVNVRPLDRWRDTCIYRKRKLGTDLTSIRPTSKQMREAEGLEL